MKNKRKKPVASDPFLSQHDIDEVRRYYLKKDTDPSIKVRNILLITLGVNLGLRASDLCKLKIIDLYKKDYLDIVEQKTNKRRIIYLNDTVKNAVNRYAEKFLILDENEFIFKSRKGNSHITPKHIYKIIKEATNAIGLIGHFGSHSLRKTTAYFAVMKNPNDKEILLHVSQMLNHTNVNVTKRYLVSSAVVDNLYHSLNL